MNPLKQRVKKLEEKAPAQKEPVFISNGTQFWTEDQKKMMIQKYPNQRMFWMPLSPKLPYGAERLPADRLALLKDLASLVTYDEERHKQQDAAIRKRTNRETLNKKEKMLLKELDELFHR